MNLLRYREEIKTPKSTLDIYTIPLTSRTFDFITSLSITTTFSVPELVKLSSITNLGVLEIINIAGRPDHTVGDRLIKAWSLAATNEGAFPVLRILKLWNHEELTYKSLVYLNSFPALAVYDVRGCGFDLSSRIHARRLGWKPTLESNILGLLQAACVERAILMPIQLGLEPKVVRQSTSQQLWDGARVWKLPRSEVRVFLTRPETAIPGPQLLKSPSYVESEVFLDCVQDNDDLAEARLNTLRWKVLDAELFTKSRFRQTWEFETYTEFSRIGELRNDYDLVQAGVQVGDQAIVRAEFVTSVPFASIRLGPTPDELKYPTVPYAHKSFYGSTLPEKPDHLLNRLKNDWDTPFNVHPPGHLSFLRINVPLPPDTSSENHIKEHDLNSLHSTTSISSMRPASAKSRASGIMKNRKRKIGEVLSAFLS